MKAIAGLIKKECDYEQKHEDFMLSLFRPDTRSDAAARGTAPPRRVEFLRRPVLATKAAHDRSD
jgi:hypothetical protein